MTGLLGTVSLWVWPRSRVHAVCVTLTAGFLVGFAALALGVGNEAFEDGYIELAGSLVGGHGYRFSASEPLVLHRPPVYPLLLVPIGALSEPAQRPALIVLHSLLLAVAGGLTYSLASRWFGPLVAGWATLIPLSHPWLMVTMKTTASSYIEIVLYLLLVGWVLSWLLDPRPEGPTLGQGAAFGAVGALLALTHGSKLLTLALILGGLAATALLRRNPRLLSVVVVAGMTAVVVIAPWTYRNWLVTGKFIPIATNAGYAYFAGNAHWGITAPMQGTKEKWQAAALRHAEVAAAPEDVGRYWGLYNVTLNEQLDAKMRAHIRANPGPFAKKMALNAVEYYFPVVHPLYAKLHGDWSVGWQGVIMNSKTIDWASISVYHALLGAAVIVGLRMPGTSVERRAAQLITLLIVMYAVPYFPFLVKAGFSRYVAVTIPLLGIVAARSRALWVGAES